MRRHFWDNFPDLHDGFCHWVIECVSELPLLDEAVEQVVRRFVEECLRLRRVGDVITAVDGWTGGERVRITPAARALELGLTDVHEGMAFRQQCYSWATDPRLAVPLARVVIASCVDVIILNYPNQALVRLHHLTFHRNGEVAGVARAEILRLAGDRRILRRLLARLTDQKFRRLVRPSDRRLFLTAATPDRLDEGPPLVGEKVVRQQLVEGWKAVFDLDEKRDYENVVRRWLDAHATGGHRGLLDVLVDACGNRFCPRATLFAIGRQWCEENGRGPDGHSRLATFAYVESAIDAVRDCRPNQEGRAP